MKKTFSALLVFLLMLAVLPVGIGKWNAPAMAAGPTIVQIAAGYFHSLALFSDGSLYAWGDNELGQLGDGTNTSRLTPVKIGTGFSAIAAGVVHSLALKGNTLYAWGDNRNGGLGDGTLKNRNMPVKIGTGYTAIAGGDCYTLALKGNKLFAWGNNEYGQLGDGTNTNKYIPVQIGTGYTVIAAGGYHSLACKGNTLYAWGNNEYGQLGNGKKTNKNTPVQIGTGYTAIAAGDIHSLALKGNILYTWGDNSDGQLGDGNNFLSSLGNNTPVQIGAGYTAIAAGGFYSLALKGNTLFAWGNNDYGQLGDETYSERTKPVRIGTGYTAIAARGFHSLALKGNALYALGYNSHGELGDGTKTEKNKPTLVKFPETSTNPASVKLDKTTVNLLVGKSITLKATVSPNNANQKVTWSSNNKAVATVSSGGVVKGIKAGTATITARTVNGKTAKCVVTVIKK